MRRRSTARSSARSPTGRVGRGVPLFLVAGSCAMDAAQLDALGAAAVLEATDEFALHAAGAALAGRRR